MECGGSLSCFLEYKLVVEILFVNGVGLYYFVNFIVKWKYLKVYCLMICVI